LFGFGTRQTNKGFVAHEWGTFTSVQGADGVLLDWKPLESSKLPGFVYDWKKPGLNRAAINPFAGSKGRLVTLQRMETPVIYFYSEERQKVEVSVSFPKGLITEWYPQADQIGPSTAPAPAPILKLDELAHKAGVKPGFTFASLLRRHSVKDSLARWTNVEIVPKGKNSELANSLPQDQSGSHYFAARDTQANHLQVDSLATNSAQEHEKFIFYRGVGNFSTPLRVTMAGDGSITIANTGTEVLQHIFVFDSENGAGRYITVHEVSPGKEERVQFQSQPLALETVSEQLGEEMTKALTGAGLYEAEAKAMVNTWKDSWFRESGLRVLYVLPRVWTDQTLPLKLDPSPRELARVMVGRAEVITPALQQSLAASLVKAKASDAEAEKDAVAAFKKLGRFAEPALRLATKDSSTEITQAAWRLFQIASRPVSESSSL